MARAHIIERETVYLSGIKLGPNVRLHAAVKGSELHIINQTGKALYIYTLVDDQLCELNSNPPKTSCFQPIPAAMTQMERQSY